MASVKIREGDLYDMINVAGIVFEIRYGFYEDFERDSWEPMPIFPDFIKNPVYTPAGEAIVTRMQDICNFYLRREGHTDDDSCGDCIYFKCEAKKAIGICENNKRNINNDREAN